MKILFFGDIMGRSGRDALAKHLPPLLAQHQPDFVIANAENAAAGYGLTMKIAADLFALGIHVLTTGNHVWDQKELLSSIDQEERILRPINFPKDTPGRGFVIARNANGKKILVINVMGRLFMDAMDDPFATTKACIDAHPLGKAADLILVDVHAEASSEKQAMGHYLDGKVSAVVGSHTHVPTADARVLPNGTAFQTDSGMCGDYDSVIGMVKEKSVAKMVRKYSFDRLGPAEGEGTICGCLIETDDKTGLATRITPIMAGGVLGAARAAS
jgi:metallophosphoesterase (TIGR00282 family)